MRSAFSRGVQGVVFAAAVCVAATEVHAVSIDRTAGFTGDDGLTMHGAARLAASPGGAPCVPTAAPCVVSLVRAGESFTRGGVATATAVNVGSFFATARVALRGREGAAPDADGLTFFVRAPDSAPLGGTGGGLGFGPDPGFPADPVRGARMRKSVAVKLDIWDNAGEGRSSTGLYVDGELPGARGSVDLLPSGIDLRSGHPLAVELFYDGVPLHQSITDEVTGASFQRAYDVDIPARLGGNLGVLGWSAATGGATADIALLGARFEFTCPAFSQGTRCVEACPAGAFLVGTACVATCPADLPFDAPAPATEVLLTPGAVTLNGAARFTAGGAACDPAVASCAVTLTEERHTFARASFFTTQRLPLASFDVRAVISMTHGAASGADALAFVVQGTGPEALGGVGGGLGFGPDPNAAADPVRGARIVRSAAVKLDLWSNAGEGPSSTGLFLDGAPPTNPGSIDLRPAGIDLHAGHPLTVRFQYDGVRLRQTLTVAATGATFTRDYPIDLVARTGGPFAHLGFTAATGGATATIRVGELRVLAAGPRPCVAECPAGTGAVGSRCEPAP